VSERERDRRLALSFHSPLHALTERQAYTSSSCASVQRARDIAYRNRDKETRDIFRERSVILNREGNSCASFVGQCSVNVCVRTGPCTFTSKYIAAVLSAWLSIARCLASPTWRCEASYSRLSSVQPEPRGFFSPPVRSRGSCRSDHPLLNQRNYVRLLLHGCIWIPYTC